MLLLGPYGNFCISLKHATLQHLSHCWRANLGRLHVGVIFCRTLWYLLGTCSSKCTNVGMVFAIFLPTNPLRPSGKITSYSRDIVRANSDNSPVWNEMGLFANWEPFQCCFFSSNSCSACITNPSLLLVVVHSCYNQSCRLLNLLSELVYYTLYKSLLSIWFTFHLPLHFTFYHRSKVAF